MNTKPKSNQKSIRLTDFTVAAIEDTVGENFSDKLERLVYDYAQHERDLHANISALTKERDELKRQIGDLSTVHLKIRRIKQFLDQADDLISPQRGKVDNTLL
ncbi:hypothetical protein FACS1894208_11680 [Clostridia bacterium]|nr:hypothetical protein FACS1894208_11680 [Clostridia bacterium]